MNQALSFREASINLEGNSLVVDAEYCVNLRARREICRRCADACPADALTLGLDEVKVERDACHNCGACNAVCPTAALSLSGFNPGRFVEAAAQAEAAHLHCRESRSTGGGAVIPCHQLLDRDLIAAASAEGVRQWHLHGLEHCEQCPRGDAREHCRTLGDELQRWFGEQAPAWELAPTDDSAGERQLEHQQRVSRRHFLRFAGAEGVEQAVRWIVPLEQPEDQLDALPFYQSSEHPQRPQPHRQQLVGRVDQLAWSENAPLPWRPRVVSEDCTLCGSCGARCPTGALLQQEQGGVVALGFAADLCTDCGLCEQVCPTGAVTAQPPLSAIADLGHQRQLLIRRQQRACLQCGHAYLPAADEAYCPCCSKERELDEDWMAMLGS